jgi:uncharacterized protein
MSPPIELPKVFIDDVPGPPPPILAFATDVTAFVGSIGTSGADQVVEAGSLSEFSARAPGVLPLSALALSVRLFFENGGRQALIANRLEALEERLFNMLCVPIDDGATSLTLADHEAAAQLCEKKRALYLVDPPSSWFLSSDPVAMAQRESWLLLRGNSHSALYFPRLKVRPGPRRKSVIVPPSGAIAGVTARVDRNRGVWKSASGLETTINGVAGLEFALNDEQNGSLNPEGINCLRQFPPSRPVIWGARTRAGADALGSDWKYVSVRRLALFMEASIANSLGWAVFEPNGEPLWARIRLVVGAFLSDLFRQGAFQGSTANSAYYVKCGHETMTQNDIARGLVTIEVGFAPMKPAEFVVIGVQTHATTS